MAGIRLYIDYENVQSEGLHGISELDPVCTTNIIYSKKAEKIRMSEVMELLSAGSKIRFFEAENGTPNALDFQLLTLLLLDYADNRDDVFIVISKDSGYDCAVRTARKAGVRKISRCTGIENFLQSMPRVLSGLREQAAEIRDDRRPDGITVDEERIGITEVSSDPENWGLDTVVFETAQMDSTHTEDRQESRVAEDVMGCRDDGKEIRKEDTKPKAFVRETKKKELASRADRIQRHLYVKKGILYSDSDCGMIADALAKSKNKMQFYQYFQKQGGKNGVEFYRRIRSEYDALAKI